MSSYDIIWAGCDTPVLMEGLVKVKHRPMRTVTLAGVLLLLVLLCAAVASAQDPPEGCPDSPHLASADEAAVVRAAESALKGYRPPGIEGWSIVSVQGAGEWAVVPIAPTTTGGGPVAGDGDILLAHREDRAWQVALPSSAAFRTWLPLVPEDLLVPFPERNAFAVLASPQAASAGLYRLPYACDARAWVSRAGADHDNAIDFIIESATRGGDPIVAAAEGVVYRVTQSRTACCCNSSYSSNWIILRHDNGEYSYYLHLAANSALVKVGDRVRQGDPIAAEGDVGYTCSTAGGSCRTRTCYVTGDWDYCCEHLHFELRNNGSWSGSRLNPRFEDVAGEFVTSQKAYISGNCPGCDDGDAPTAEYGEETPQPGAYFDDSVSLSGWAEDDGECISGIDHVDVRALFDGEWNGAWCGEWCTVAQLALDGGEGTPVEFATTWDLSDVPPGEILLALEVYDQAGNHSANASGVRPIYRMADSPPHLSLDLANDQPIASQGQVVRSSDAQWSFSGTASDAEGLAQVTMYATGGSDWTGSVAGVADWSYPLSGTVGLGGATMAVFRVYDTQGQHNPPGDRDTVQLLVDSAPPRTLVDLEGTPGENGWYRSPVTVHLAAQDLGSGQGWGTWASGLASLHYQVDDGDWQDQVAPNRTLTFPGQDGGHALGCYAVDDLGNTESVQQVPVRIDVTPPGAPGGPAEAHDVPSGVWQEAVSRPAFTWDPADDATSGVWIYRVSWGDTLALTTTASFTPSAVATGVYTLTIRAVDRAGNQGPATVSYVFRYDGSPPHAPQIQHRAGVLSGVCQNQVRRADFAWPTPQDAGSGVAGYRLYWGPDADGVTTTLTTTETYSNPVPICPEYGAATYTLRAQAEDRVGWDSQWVPFALVYDGAPPTATLAISDVLTTTENATVTLTITATDEGCGVDRMRLSGDGETWSDWQPLSLEVDWLVPDEPGQGVAIYLHVMDRAGNVSEVVSTSVQIEGVAYEQGAGIALAAAGPARSSVTPAADLETACPFYRLTVNGGTGYTTAPTVTLRLCGPDPAEVLLANDPEFQQATWRPYTETVTWTLGGTGLAAGERWVYARFRDSSGAVHGTFADDVVYDPDPPQGKVAFRIADLLPAGAGAERNGGRLAVAQAGSAVLAISAADAASGLDVMQVSLLPDLEGVPWQPFSATIPFTFTVDGVYTVHVRLRDGAGNLSVVLSDSIIVDTLPPAGTAQVAGGTVGPAAVSATLALSATDGTAGVSEVRVGASPLFTDTAWQAYAPQITVPISPSGAPSGTLYVQFRDAAGNRSAMIPAPYQVDGTPPQGWIEYLSGGIQNTRTYALHVEEDLSPLAETWISADYWFLEGVSRLPFQDPLTWKFTDGRYAFARFVDTAGNVSRPYLLLCPGYGDWSSVIYLPVIMKVK
jgi:hypothetical protein